MALADLIPGAIEIFRDEGRIEGREQGMIEGIKVGKIEGRAKGLEEGWKQGKKEGRQEGQKTTLIRMLNKKIKSEASEKVLMQIEEASIEKLDKLEDNIFEITSWEEVEDIIKN